MPQTIYLPQKKNWWEPMMQQGSNFLWQLAMAKAMHKIDMEKQEVLIKQRQAEKQEERSYQEGVLKSRKLETRDIGGQPHAVITEMGAPVSVKQVNIPKESQEKGQWTLGEPFKLGENFVIPQQAPDGKIIYEKFPLGPDGKPNPEVALKAGTQLREEFTRGSKQYIAVRDSMGRILASAEPPVTGAGDLALIFNYMKVLDPQSVVRESEFATAETSGQRLSDQGVPTFIIRLREKIFKGGRLTPKQRSEFVTRAKMLYGKQEQRHKQFIKQYERLSKSYSVPRENVIIDYLIPPKELSATKEAFPEITDEQLKERKRLEDKYGITQEDYVQ